MLFVPHPPPPPAYTLSLHDALPISGLRSNRDRPVFRAAMEQLSEHGERFYRQLTEETPGFLVFFYQATAVDEIGMLNISSRPSHRTGKKHGNDSVMDIPCMFG